MSENEKMNRRQKLGIATLFLVSLMNAFDRQIAMVVAEPIRTEWQLSDAQIGLLAGAFTLIYAISGLPMGLLTDRFPRFKFLAIGTFAWSLLTAAGGLVSTYGQLLTSRIAVGVAESTFFPASMSLLGDLVSFRRRNLAVGLVLLGIPVGIGLSFGVGGAVAQARGWRSAFFLALVPGLVASLVCFFLREPTRGASERHRVGAKGRGPSAFGVLAKIPTFWVVVAAGALHMFASLSQAAFLAPLLMRNYGMSVEEAGKNVGLIAGLAPCLGMLIAAPLTDRLARGRRNAPMLVGLVTLSLTIPAFVFALQCPIEKRGVAVALFAVTQFLSFPFISAQQTIIQEIVEPAFRGTAVAVQTLAASLLGAALGPMVTGALSDAWATKAAERAGYGISSEALEPFRAEGIRLAMYVVPTVLGLLCLVLFVGLRLMRRDAEALSSWMAREEAVSLGSSTAV